MVGGLECFLSSRKTNKFGLTHREMIDGFLLFILIVFFHPFKFKWKNAGKFFFLFTLHFGHAMKHSVAYGFVFLYTEHNCMVFEDFKNHKIFRMESQGTEASPIVGRSVVTYGISQHYGISEIIHLTHMSEKNCDFFPLGFSNF
jgi:hypothetical protein